MIPQRICLKGFLCYREEQEVLFDGSSLWMLSGLNGSGKSTIFDAVTYALFGHHRGGSQRAVELINHDCEQLSVEFDFTLDGVMYQARRTLKRKADGGSSSTQQLYQFRDGSKKKEAIEGTNAKRAFDEWIRDNVGLTFETFTSSVLLLQNRAEKLLDSTAAGRFEVLAGIVDLERYRRLHESADARRKDLKSKIEALEHQFEGLPIVSPEQRQEIEDRLSAALWQREQLQDEVEQLQSREMQARAWLDAQSRLQAILQRLDLAQTMMSEADLIRQEANRLRELQAVVPLLQTVVEKRAEIRRSLDTRKKLSTEAQQLGDQVRLFEGQIDQASKTRDALARQLTLDDLQYRQVSARLRELASILERVKLCEQQRDKVTELEAKLAGFPADLLAGVNAARVAHDACAQLAQVLPQLVRFARLRRDLRAAREREQLLLGQKPSIEERGKGLRDKHAALKTETDEATRRREEAAGEVQVARTLFQQARDQLELFNTLEGAAVCRHCGQQLTRSHFAREQRRLQQVRDQADERLQKAETVLASQVREERRLKEELDRCEKDLSKAREDFQDCRRHLQDAQKEITRLQDECRQGYLDLPEAFRGKITSSPLADWPDTTYPTDDDLDAARTEAAQLEGLRKRLREVEKQQEQWQRLTLEIASARDLFRTLEAQLPGNVDDLRHEHSRLQAEESSLAARIRSQRDEEKKALTEQERLTKEREGFVQRLTTVNGRITTEDAQRRLFEETIEGARRSLPEVWRVEVESADSGALFRWTGERDKLVARDVEGRVQQLQQAIYQLESLRQQKSELEAQCAAFPAEVRCPPDELKRQVESKKRELETCDQTLQRARQEKAKLESQLEQREQISQQLTKLQGEHNRFALLAQLLGRDRLQRFLVRQAERQVVDHANAVLDRLSGGQLYLRLRGGDDGDMADRALEMEVYNRQTSDGKNSPINVAFLSGSQRFRVAVSLALGIGQYASKQHRPIESVIIDEGFGCLDRQGRQVMIQELMNLRSQLRCILLVSHQEEFADAFANGYHFELQSGATRVTPIRR
jgi:DNA repair exonuclease SbcCD ATPase subunit